MVQLAKRKFPTWLRRQLPEASAADTEDILGKYRLNTVCDSALCPNRSECYARRTATFMILGDICTRSCGFCHVKTGRGEEVMEDEPERVAKAARELGLRYVVLTSVARDDLPDEGSGHFAATVKAVREAIPAVEIEVLTPDFHARPEWIEKVVVAKPDVFNHNIETVKRLQKPVRIQATYERSLKVLQEIKKFDPDMTTKSGIMLGLGETEDEIIQTAQDLRLAGCDILTIGQYLQPSQKHLPVVDYKTPAYFEDLAQRLKPMGFRHVFSGPYVRSSYHAGEVFSVTKEH